MQSWLDEAGVDGFNLARTVVPESYTDFIDLVVPELQNRGLHKTAYAEGTLRHKLAGRGDRLAPTHHGAGFRPAPGHAPCARRSKTAHMPPADPAGEACGATGRCQPHPHDQAGTCPGRRAAVHGRATAEP